MSHFYGWDFAYVRSLRLIEYHAAGDYMQEYRNARANSQIGD